VEGRGPNLEGVVALTLSEGGK